MQNAIGGGLLGAGLGAAIGAAAGGAPEPPWAQRSARNRVGRRCRQHAAAYFGYYGYPAYSPPPSPGNWYPGG